MSSTTDNTTEERSELTDKERQQLRERTVEMVREGIEPHHLPENLKVLYVEHALSQAEIAEFYGVDQATISRQLRHHGIETRPSVSDPEYESPADQRVKYRLQEYCREE